MYKNRKSKNVRESTRENEKELAKTLN